MESLFRLAIDVGEPAVMREHVPRMPPRLRGDAHVLECGNVGQYIRDLVGARDALL